MASYDSPLMVLLLVLMGMGAGAIVGSYVATLCIRWSQGQQASVGRSACDACGHQLDARDLVPVLSYLAVNGRCRTCGARINPAHLQVELAAAAIGGVSLLLSPGLQGAALALFGMLLLPSAWLDARFHWLPDRLTILLAIGGLSIGNILVPVAMLDRLIGGCVGFGILLAIRLGYARLRHQEGLGAGDPKLFGAIGLWLGWLNLPFVLLLGSAGGLLAALIFRRGRFDRFPFGTALAAGAWFCGAAQVAGGS